MLHRPSSGFFGGILECLNSIVSPCAASFFERSSSGLVCCLALFTTIGDRILNFADSIMLIRFLLVLEFIGDSWALLSSRLYGAFGPALMLNFDMHCETGFVLKNFFVNFSIMLSQLIGHDT